MPAPTVYSESTYADYLASVLGSLADVLGWDAGSAQVQEAVADAMLDMGLTDIADATTSTQIRGLRALGRRAIWRAVVQATAGFYAFTDVSQQQFSRQQINDQASKMLSLAETDCLEWSPSYAVGIVTIKRPADPYVVIPDEERVP